MIQSADILEKYIEQIENNVREAIVIQNIARTHATTDKEGNRSFIIPRENSHVSETITLSVNKENIPLLAPEDAVNNKMLELAREKILEQDAGFQTAKKSKFEYFSTLNEKDKKAFDEKVAHYIENTPQLKNKAIDELLIANGVMPKIINRALQKSADTAQKMNVLKNTQISIENDEGYCTKSLFIPMYELKKQYGGFEWLPDSAETASHPILMIDHLKSVKAASVSGTVNLNSEVTKYDAGAIVMVNQKDGHMHAMMYNGINEKTGKPQYIGFNSNDYNRSISDKREGIIINLPQIIEQDFAGKNTKSNEYIENEPSQQIFSESIINYPERKEFKKFESLSRGEKAEYISLKIERLRQRLNKNEQTSPAEEIKNGTNHHKQNSNNDYSVTNIVKFKNSNSK